MARQARPGRWRRLLLIALAFTICIAVGAAAGVVAGYFRSVPALDEVNFDPKLTTYIYDSRGGSSPGCTRKTGCPSASTRSPNIVRLAFLAAEDDDFYNHHGIDFWGIARAMWVNLRTGAIQQGGSTITQQLAKLAFLTNDRTWSRKLKELLWSIQIERKYTKDEILEAYLNVVYFGHGAYGVEAASQIFFQKHVGEVNLPEAALLAAIVNGPGYYSPFYDMDAAHAAAQLRPPAHAGVGLHHPAPVRRSRRDAHRAEGRPAAADHRAVLRHVRPGAAHRPVRRADGLHGRPAGLHHPGPGHAAGCRAGHRSHGACPGDG